MEKVKLEIVGLSYSQTQSGAYALVLAEENGTRRLPIIIGGFEAQAIAIELEKMTPTRPLTHDLFKNFALAYDISVKEILIYNLVEGIFYAKLVCDRKNEIIEIDARTSDAIAIGVRFNCPVFTYESILGSAGIQLDDADEFSVSPELEEPENTQPKGYSHMTLDELEVKLDEALSNEDYELASKIRDEINRRSS
jgi:bifunctional DNase/RNase